jgi:hypothetical protein
LSPVERWSGFPQIGDLALNIRLDGWFLRIALVLSDPAAQRRETDPEICCHLPMRQTAGQRYAHCFGAEFLGWS